MVAGCTDPVGVGFVRDIKSVFLWTLVSSTPTPQQSQIRSNNRRGVSSLIRSSDATVIVVSFDAISQCETETTPRRLMPGAVETLDGLMSLGRVKVVVFADAHNKDVQSAFEGLKELDGLEVRTSHGRQVRVLSGGSLGTAARSFTPEDTESSQRLLAANEVALRKAVNAATSGHLDIVFDGASATVVPRLDDLQKRHEIIYSAYRFLEEANGKAKFRDEDGNAKNFDLDVFFDRVKITPFDSADGMKVVLSENKGASVVFVTTPKAEFDPALEPLHNESANEGRVAVMEVTTDSAVSELSGVLKMAGVTNALQSEAGAVGQTKGREITQS